MNRNHRRRRQALVLATAATLLAGGLAASAGAAPAAKPSGKDKVSLKVAKAAARHSDRDQGHVQPHPLKIAQLRAEQRQAALERKMQGKRPYPKGVGPSKQVPLELEGEDKVFVVLVEFGDERYPAAQFSDTPTPAIQDPKPVRFDGPLHNQIPQPDRSIDNSTLWQADYSRAHYEDMYFNRMKEYYERQSSGRYTVDGTVTEWVKVPFNYALYGRNYCGSIVCNTSKALVRDAMAVWVKSQLDAGMSMADLTAYLKTFDQKDRYDSDFDGNYDEPDGFIDRMQVVHAGGDEAAGDPTYGTDAIWSHRSYANLQGGGPNGYAGINIGTNTGLVSSDKIPNNPTGVWAGDYTMQPENGGLGVFAHEYGHDLGLPDLYDTSGNTGGAENNTAFWTLMSSGSNVGDGGSDGIGDDPVDMGAWERMFLGWMDAQGDKGPFYETVEAGEDGQVRLSKNVPATTNGMQAAVVNLPDNVVDYSLGEPPQGDWMWWSQTGANINNTMTKTGVSAGTLTAKVSYVTEEEYDYIFVEASANGTDFAPVDTNLSDHPGHAGHDPDGNNPSGYGITGSTDGAFVDLSATLPAGTTAVRLRYQTDPLYSEQGLLIDDIKLNGASIGTAETGDDGWVLDGFKRTNGTEQESFYNAYIVENRQYDGDDDSLKTAYNFGFLETDRPDWVEFHPYQNGALIWYLNDEWNLGGSFDNNVGDHPGEGFLLPVDAHPQFSHWPDGTLMRNRILSADSTFGYEKTPRVVLHKEGVAGVLPSYKGQPVFDDTAQWWWNADEHAATGEHEGRYQPGWYGVDVPKTGTTIKVAKPGSRNGTMDIIVTRAN